MSDQRFERDLRAVLAEDAPDVAPATLRVALQQVVAGTRNRRAVSPGVLHRVGPILAGLASFALIGLVLTIAVVSRTGPVPGFGAAPNDASLSPTPAFLWDSGVVRLTADEARITAGGREFLVDPGPISVDSDPGSETYQTLELAWREHGREMRLYMYFEADNEQWWLNEVRTNDGQEPAEWVTYPGPLLRAPLGEPFTGSIERTSADGQHGFRLEELRLEAFRDGRTRESQDGCRPVAPPADAYAGDATDFMADTGLLEMSPDEAADWLAVRALCVNWRFQYRTDDQGSGYGEYWCVPPRGVITDLAPDSNGHLVVFVQTPGDPILPHRPQPAVGWGCD